MEKGFSLRCGKETAYDINMPVTIRRWYIEGAGQKWTRMLKENVAYERRDKRWQGIQDLNQIR